MKRVQILNLKLNSRRQNRSATSLIEGLEQRRLLAAATTPFPQTMPTVPTNSVLFANFDNGGEGVAFHDYDKRNLGGDYRRKNIGVDIERNEDADPTNLGDVPGVGRDVGYTRASEYLKYTLNVASDGIYTFNIRFASSTGGTAHLAVDGQDATGTIALTRTGGWEKWKTIEKTGVTLSAGTHVFKFVIDSATYGGEVGNLHWFSFTKTADPTESVNASLAWPDSWTRIADAPFARYEAMDTVFNGKVYLFGGYDDNKYRVSKEYRVYDPNTNQWTLLGSMPSGVAETHIVPVDDGKYIYFVGGFKGDLLSGVNPPQQASDRTFRLDPATNAWSELPKVPRLQGAGGSAIIGRKLHFFGGNSADRVTNIGDHWVLDLDHTSQGWTRAAPMPDPKNHFSTVVLGGKIYALGGEYGHDVLHQTQKSVHVYDPATDKWKRLADLPIALSHAEGSTFAYDGHIIFAGGQLWPDQSSSDKVFSYDPSTNKWSELYHLPYYLQGAIVHVFGKKVIVSQGARFTETALPWTFVGSI